MAATVKQETNEEPREPVHLRKAQAQREIAHRIDALSVGITPKREKMLQVYAKVMSGKADPAE